MQKNKVRGDGMLQAVTHFYFVPWSLLVDLSPYDIWYLDFLIFCESRSIRISRLYEKHEIANTIKSRITRASIRVSKGAD